MLVLQLDGLDQCTTPPTRETFTWMCQLTSNFDMNIIDSIECPVRISSGGKFFLATNLKNVGVFNNVATSQT